MDSSLSTSQLCGLALKIKGLEMSIEGLRFRDVQHFPAILLRQW